MVDKVTVIDFSISNLPVAVREDSHGKRAHGACEFLIWFSHMVGSMPTALPTSATKARQAFRNAPNFALAAKDRYFIICAAERRQIENKHTNTTSWI